MNSTNLPQLILGGGGLNKNHLNLLDAWYAAGGRCIDTARVYGDSEAIIGQWIRSSGVDDIQIITKGCHHDENGNRVHAAALKEDINRSMDALGVEHIHCYILHRDDLSLPAEDILQHLQSYFDHKIIGCLGASNWTTQRIASANAAADQHGWEPFRLHSPQYSAVKPLKAPWPGCISISNDPNGMKWHLQDKRMHLLAWQPLAAGFLARSSIPEDPEHVSHCFVSPENQRRKEELIRIATEHDLSLAQIATAWILQQPRCHAIIGTKSITNWQAAQSSVALPPDIFGTFQAGLD